MVPLNKLYESFDPVHFESVWPTSARLPKKLTRDPVEIPLERNISPVRFSNPRIILDDHLPPRKPEFEKELSWSPVKFIGIERVFSTPDEVTNQETPQKQVAQLNKKQKRNARNRKKATAKRATTHDSRVKKNEEKRAALKNLNN